ncbi:MAG: Asp23/Gls24 family envelope stress response protein, partial [Candidatus Limnocylindrales bacterium]
WPAALDEDQLPVSDEPIPGRALASRRAVMDIVRAATLGSYGVAGFAGGPIERFTAWLDGHPAGLRVQVSDAHLAIRLDLRVAHGLPVAEVARQVESAIRYAVRRALGREVDALAIRIGGLETVLGTPPPGRPTSSQLGSSDLADSGTDVA